MLDVLPARVTSPSGQRWQPARVWLTDTRFILHVQDGPKARQVFDLPHDGYTQKGRITEVTLLDETWIVERRGGCACGSPLKKLSYSAWQAEQDNLVSA